MKCYVDMDGVLVNFMKGMCELKCLPDPYELEAFKGIFDLRDVWGMTDDELWLGCDREWWKSLEPYSYAFDLMAMLEDHFGKKNVAIMSAPTGREGCTDGKEDWIREYFPKYIRRTVFTQLKDFIAHKDTLLIDDRDANCDKFAEAGGHVFLWAQPWNANHNWSDCQIKDLRNYIHQLCPRAL